MEWCRLDTDLTIAQWYNGQHCTEATDEIIEAYTDTILEITEGQT